jgi:hypothetical protein
MPDTHRSPVSESDGSKPSTKQSQYWLNRHGADQAMALLKQAITAGFSNPSHLKNDPPLGSLRSQPDFQELMRPSDRPAK